MIQTSQETRAKRAPSAKMRTKSSEGVRWWCGSVVLGGVSEFSECRLMREWKVGVLGWGLKGLRGEWW